MVTVIVSLGNINCVLWKFRGDQVRRLSGEPSWKSEIELEP